MTLPQAIRPESGLFFLNEEKSNSNMDTKGPPLKTTRAKTCRRKLMVLALAVAITVLSADIGLSLTFDQYTSTGGVLVKTDQKTYILFQKVNIETYLLNGLSYPFNTCVGYIGLSFRGPFGLDGGYGTIYDYSGPDPHCGRIEPGGQRLVDLREWSSPILGQWSVEVSIRTTNYTLPKFTGSTTIMVLPLGLLG